MKPWQWAVLPLRRYAQFNGRAPRPEFWWFHLLTVAVFVASTAIDLKIDPNAMTTGTPYVAIATALALLLPWFAVAIRRLHDADYNWWAVLLIVVPYVGIVVLLWNLGKRGHFGDNIFGPDPYGRSASQSLVEPTIRQSRTR